jgi:hypothetical protein
LNCAQFANKSGRAREKLKNRQNQIGNETARI